VACTVHYIDRAGGTDGLIDWTDGREREREREISTQAIFLTV